MEATELMIGDWVEVILNSEKHFARVQTIDGYGDNATSNECVCDAIYYSIDELKPISLTPEILEKNGFSIDDSFHPHRRWNSADRRVVLHNEDEYLNTFNKWHVHVDTEDMRTIGSIELTYVHQLQQFLRLCGMNELADNFKI